jgi:hypothetical protein
LLVVEKQSGRTTDGHDSTMQISPHRRGPPSYVVLLQLLGRRRHYSRRFFVCLFLFFSGTSK